MAYQVVWHGTQLESFDLVNAIARNCTCEFGLMGVRLATCAPHWLLTEDQRALNGLLFARRMVVRLSREEFFPRQQPVDESTEKLIEELMSIPVPDETEAKVITPEVTEQKTGSKWLPTEQDLIDLRKVVTSICDESKENKGLGGDLCNFSNGGGHTCAAHENLKDEAASSHLVWMKTRTEHLLEEEFKHGEEIVVSEVDSSLAGTPESVEIQLNGFRVFAEGLAAIDLLQLNGERET